MHVSPFVMSRKTLLVDHMIKLMERYTDNLEELVMERTDELEQEKQKTDNLLNSMLPRSLHFSLFVIIFIWLAVNLTFAVI